MGEEHGDSGGSDTPKWSMDDALKPVFQAVVRGVKAANAIPKDEAEYSYLTKRSSKAREEIQVSQKEILGILKSLVPDGEGKEDQGHKGKDFMDKHTMDREELSVNGVLNGSSLIQDYVDDLLEDVDDVLAGKVPQRFNDLNKKDTNEDQPKREADTATSNHSKANKNGNVDKPADMIRSEEENLAPFRHKFQGSKPHAIANVAGSDDEVGASDNENEDEDEQGTVTHHPYLAETNTLKYQRWQMNKTEDDAKSAQKPKALKDTKCTFIDNVQDLDSKLLAALKNCNIFAMDLEHHGYRSFQGFLSLMQISTTDEDFIIDTIALKKELHKLNVVTADPKILKVMHGADMDILWLQRDLGIYIVNLFDTGQAARVLHYPGFSLAYLLQLHCKIKVDKQYQLADWRQRPLSKAMLKYAQEDTHYLLFIYERMKAELISSSQHNASDLLMQTYTNSKKISLLQYRNPLWSKRATMKGLRKRNQDRMLIGPRMSIYLGLSELRDAIARKEDESLGYVSSNDHLMKLALCIPLKKGTGNEDHDSIDVPTTTVELVRLFKSSNHGHQIPNILRFYGDQVIETLKGIDLSKTNLEAKEGVAIDDVYTPGHNAEVNGNQGVTSRLTDALHLNFDSAVSDLCVDDNSNQRRTKFQRQKSYMEPKLNLIPMSNEANLGLPDVNDVVEDRDDPWSIARRNLSARLGFLMAVTHNTRSEEFGTAPEGQEDTKVDDQDNETDVQHVSIAEAFSLPSHRKRKVADSVDDNDESVNGNHENSKSATPKEVLPNPYVSALAKKKGVGSDLLNDNLRPDSKKSESMQQKNTKKRRKATSGYNPFIGMSGNKKTEDSKGKGGVVKVKRTKAPSSMTFR